MLSGIIRTDKLEKRPCVLWFVDPDDGLTTRRIEQTTMVQELTAVALQKFHCFRVVSRLQPAGFLFFDAELKAHGKPLVGKRHTSWTTFRKRIERLFDECYVMSAHDWYKRNYKLLDRRDELDAREEVLRQEKKRLKELTELELAKKVEEELARIAKEREAITEEEASLKAECRLREAKPYSTNRK